MTLSTLFRRRRKITTIDVLAGDLKRAAATLAWRSVVDYTRTRLGPRWTQVFPDEGFRRHVERSRLLAYPRLLALAAEVLCLAAGTAGRDAAFAVVVAAAARRALAGQDPGTLLEAEVWPRLCDMAVAAVAHRSGNPRRLTELVDENELDTLIALMPLDGRLIAGDRATIRHNLRLGLGHLHDSWRGRIDVAALLREATT